MLEKDFLQDGWVEISYKSISPAQFKMRIFSSFLISYTYKNHEKNTCGEQNTRLQVEVDQTVMKAQGTRMKVLLF